MNNNQIKSGERYMQKNQTNIDVNASKSVYNEATDNKKS